MRLLPAVVAAIVIAIAIPSSASASKGWRLPTITDTLSGLKLKTGAAHCGKSKFGLWKFRARITGEGKVARMRWKTKVTADGTLHRITGVRVTGSAPASAKKTIARTLRSQRARYLAGPPPSLETVAPNGQQLSSRPFKPKRKRC